MYPFDKYHKDRSQQLGILRGGKARHDYCHQLVFEFGAEVRCAYCGLNLLEPYENWLHLERDHVVPHQMCKVEGWANCETWIKDAANCVICCSACNNFMQEKIDEPPPQTWEEFVTLRDKVYLRKRDTVLKKQYDERYYWNHEWRSRLFTSNGSTA